MMSNSEFGSISFDLPKNQSNVIKVIGVGGGGSNAINHMFKQGIKGVDFIVCNTDSQALQNSAVPNKIQLGVHLTEGLGAGANPDVGQQSAIESISDIEKMLDQNTKINVAIINNSIDYIKFISLISINIKIWFNFYYRDNNINIFIISI
jgi:cell division protein FtsZ